MTISPLLAEPFPIPPHAIAAMTAMVLGAIQLLMRKGTALHRGIGYIWVVLMAVVAISGLFIFELRMIGPFSPIHLLSFFVLYVLFVAVRAARSGNIRRHKSAMIQLYILALLLTGLFTLLPGRVMHQVVFG